MRVFISCDIEGAAGIAHWDETDYDRGGRWYDYFRGQMTREAAAACKGAKAGGASAIRVKDAHDSARNIIPDGLPEGVTIHRGWSGSPFSMVSGLDEGYDALAFVGYHSPAHSDGNPLAHTMSTAIDELTINGVRTSEFLIHGYIAAMLGIPVIFLSGDAALCAHARALAPGIATVATNTGAGGAVTSMHPSDALAAIEDTMRRALENKGADCLLKLPERFDVSVKYKEHPHAFRAAYFPGAAHAGEKTVSFAADNYMDVLRFFHFVL
ncbi:MAG: M55 family metallopeptidase [Clostridiales bacterium]|nr:M55 family metallopeptidase [Clostridiales bacterium]